MKLKLEKTKLADEFGRPITFYHTTDVGEKIERFHPLTHFGSQKAAQMRGFHFAYKILGAHEPLCLPNEFPKDLEKKFQDQAPSLLKTYQVHLLLKNPLKINDLGKHDKESYQQYFSRYYSLKSIYLTPQESLERDSIGVEKLGYKKALSEFIFIHPFQQSEENLKKELEAEHLFSSNIKDYKKLAETVAYQRMIRFLEGEGYDGFSYVNDCEDVGQKSYIIFRSEQVFQNQEVEHEIPKMTIENQRYLNKIENDFFKERGFIPPHQRKELNRQIRARQFAKLTK